jgi:hypothetical protein
MVIFYALTTISARFLSRILACTQEEPAIYQPGNGTLLVLLGAAPPATMTAKELGFPRDQFFSICTEKLSPKTIAQPQSGAGSPTKC